MSWKRHGKMMRGTRREEDELQKIMKEVCEECDTCKKYKRNPSRPVMRLPLAESFNEDLTVDQGKLHGDRFLLMVDWVTRYSQVTWIRTKILSNGGQEFQNKEMAQFAEKRGIELKYMASESPWGNRKCKKGHRSVEGNDEEVKGE